MISTRTAHKSDVVIVHEVQHFIIVVWNISKRREATSNVDKPVVRAEQQHRLVRANQFHSAACNWLALAGHVLYVDLLLTGASGSCCDDNAVQG